MSKKKNYTKLMREKKVKTYYSNILFYAKHVALQIIKKEKIKIIRKKKQEKDLFVIPKILMTSLLYKIH